MNNTIASLSSAPIEGAIGIIRMSGEDSLSILKNIFKTKTKVFKNRQMMYGHIKKEDKVIDEVMAVYMQKPNTYTKEDIVEIYCHGGIVPMKRVLDYILESGAELAEPGEFTKRAFLNGRLDLSQAESVMDLISAKTDKGFDVAYKQLEGTLSKVIKNIRQNILNLTAHMEVCIDYPEEDIEEITYHTIINTLEENKNKLEDLLKNANNGRIIREGIKIAIIGKPNVGKSSLLNALLKEARAIVTDIAGTTRDIIEEHLNIKGIPIQLVDTAGIRETDDHIEKIGVERSKEIFNKSDMVIFMLNSSEKLSEEDRMLIDLVSSKKSLIILNKIDLESKIELDEIYDIFKNRNIIKTSLLKEEGINDVEDSIIHMIYQGDINAGDAIVSNSRHIDLIKKSLQSIENALSAANANMAYDFIEVDVMNALESLGKITGETIEKDIVKEIFSNFCLGK